MGSLHSVKLTLNDNIMYVHLSACLFFLPKHFMHIDTIWYENVNSTIFPVNLILICIGPV
jgi:hypothetical protein